jgi:cell division ATP-binding protein FtsE/predicted protein insertion permease FtsX
MIRFDQVHKRYPNGREALAGVTFEVETGRLAFLTGHSGAGKSSILKLIALIERPTRGQVIVNNRNLAGIKPRAIAEFRRQIGVVFQDHKLLHDRPVMDNVALPLIIAGVARREVDKRVRAALDQVGLLGREKARPLELSTGEQQRVGIARAVVARPGLLIADEPTGNLDPDLAREVMQLFKRFSEVGVTVVVATHDIHLIEHFDAPRIVISDGRGRRRQRAMNVGTYFSRHAQVLVGSLGRIARHPLAAVMTMAVIGIALALPLLLDVFLQNARTASGNLNDAFDLSVYLDKKADSGRALALAKQLRLRGDVAAVKVIGADQALASFRGASGFGKALDVLKDNPLPDTVVVTPTLDAGTPQGTERLRAAIAAMPDVQLVQLDTDWIKRLQAILDVARHVVMLTGVLLGLGVVLIVSNTIRLDILNRRAEIEVMKLVGASDGFTRRPFLYTGVWYGLGGGVLALLLVALGTVFLDEPVARLAVLYGSSFRLEGLSVVSMLQVLAAAAALSWAGSWLAVRRHIRAIEPA